MVPFPLRNFPSLGGLLPLAQSSADALPSPTSTVHTSYFPRCPHHFLKGCFSLCLGHISNFHIFYSVLPALSPPTIAPNLSIAPFIGAFFFLVTPSVSFTPSSPFGNKIHWLLYYSEQLLCVLS